MSRTQLILLGSGTPNVLPDRSQSALAILVDDVPYLVDCGGGIMQRISQARAKGVAGLAPVNLSRLFLTHLHPDHTTGLPDLIISPWVLMRAAPLLIYGPPGAATMIDLILNAYEIGIGEHRDGLAPINHPLQVNVIEIEGGVIYEDERVTVEAIPVQHGSLAAFAYKFTCPDKVIVISGDTCYLPALAEHAAGCDMLVHEVYSAERFRHRSADWQTYHRATHTSTRELAEFANLAQPGLLILVHQLFWGATPDELVAEITRHYNGNVVSGNDLDIY